MALEPGGGVAAVDLGKQCEASGKASGKAATEDIGSLAVSPRSACNAALFCATIYLVNLAVDDLREDGRVSILHWPLLARCFSQATLTHLVALWLSCNLAVVVAGLGFRCWRRGRAGLVAADGAAGWASEAWGWAWAAAAVLLHAGMVVLPAWAAYLVDLPASATCALCFEQTRLLMKSYSYLREHVRRERQARAEATPEAVSKGLPALPSSNDSVGHLVYFLFAPTLVYRDSYERTPRVRPLAAARHGCVFLLALLTMVVATGRGALRPFCGGADVALLGLDGDPGALRFAAHLGLLVVRAAPAGAVLTVGTAVALHSWHMVFAELLLFRGRHFSQAWWNAPCYAIFFRDWNLFVKAWLHKYVYKEVLARGRSRHAARIATVAVSAFWHEYILAVSLGYVLPWVAVSYILSAAFVFPNPFAFQRGAAGNLIVLSSMSFGVASYVAFYFMESTARLQCPRTLDPVADLFVPRSLGCARPFGNCTFM